MTAIAEKKYTLEEYFELERTTDIRHEFVYGILIPMTGENKKATETIPLPALDFLLAVKDIYHHIKFS